MLYCCSTDIRQVLIRSRMLRTNGGFISKEVRLDALVCYNTRPCTEIPSIDQPLYSGDLWE